MLKTPEFVLNLKENTWICTGWVIQDVTMTVRKICKNAKKYMYEKILYNYKTRKVQDMCSRQMRTIHTLTSNNNICLLQTNKYTQTCWLYHLYICTIPNRDRFCPYLCYISMWFNSLMINRPIIIICIIIYIMYTRVKIIMTYCTPFLIIFCCKIKL